MTAVSVIGPADGERIHLGPVQMRILEDGRSTGHRLGAGEITLAPHTDGPPQHRHAAHDEGFYVVSGTARFTVGETTYHAAAGAALHEGEQVSPITGHAEQPRVETADAERYRGRCHIVTPSRKAAPTRVAA